MINPTDKRLQDAVINDALQTIEHNKGFEGVTQLFADIASPNSNNWKIADKYRISIVQVIYLRQHWNVLYNEINYRQKSTKPKLTIISGNAA